MLQATFAQMALVEHRFWLQILGDHTRFLFNSLSPVEESAIQDAHRFISEFDQLLARARTVVTRFQLQSLTACAYESVTALRLFTLELLSCRIADTILIALPPTIISHMVNETDEYLRILEFLLARTTPPVKHPLHYHLLWLADAHVHATFLSAGLDPIEANLKEKSTGFVHRFTELYFSALELKGYLRTGEGKFPALTRYNLQVEKEILLFKEFLDKLQELLSSKQLLGALTPLAVDHMLREEYYFLNKLSQFPEIKTPRYDPTRPRVAGE